VQSMENKLYETGSVVGTELATRESQGKPSEGAEGKGPIRSSHGLSRTDLEASKRLVRRLMDAVNTQEEYELLERDLEELEALCPSSSNALKGGAA
jgi:hypothetical protein